MAKAKTEAAAPQLPPTGMPASFHKTLRAWIESGVQVLWLYSDCDENRIEQALFEFGQHPGGQLPDKMPLLTWDLALGCQTYQGKTPDWDAADLREVLPGMAKAGSGKIKSGIMLMRDMHSILNAPAHIPHRRLFVELCKKAAFINGGNPADRNDKPVLMPLVIIANTPVPHSDIKEYVTVIEVPWPGTTVIRHAVVDYILQCAGDSPEIKQCPETTKLRLAESMLGLSVEEARKVFGFALGYGLQEKTFDAISDEKVSSIRKIEGLTFVPRRMIADFDENVGGYDNYLEFLKERQITYLPQFKHLSPERPRGVGLIGPAGTFKTGVGKITAKVLGLDLVIMDIGAMFQGIVGATEQRMRTALNAIAAMKNVALLIDEIDKSMANAHKSQASDSGVAGRVLSYLLQWLSDRDMANEDDNRTFVIVTMNRTDGIPPEFLRAGRFDRLFSTDLPNVEQREEILAIHLKKRGIDPAVYGESLRDVAIAADKYVGGELEEIVVSGRIAALARAAQGCNNPSGLKASDVIPTLEDMLQVTATLPAMAKVNGAEVDTILEFCRSRTTPVAKPIDPDRPRQRSVRAGNRNN